MIIGIDPGATGAICFYNDGEIEAVKMPDTNKKLFDLLTEKKKIAVGDPLIFVERLSVRPDDLITKKGEEGKIHRIIKMAGNYRALITVIELSGIPFIQVMPRVWQKFIGMPLAKDYTKRKDVAWKYAQEKFPNHKVYKYAADAYLILRFAWGKKTHDPRWIEEKLKDG